MGDFMRKIYIVLTYTGTILSRVVKQYTKKDFSHVSIALDENLKEMYSFGRLNPYNPFIGGFVKESLYYGTFKRFSKTISKIYAMDVTNSQYEAICKNIQFISRERKKYRFNMIGLCAVAFHFPIKRKNCFYCAEFVKYVLENTSLDVSLPDIVKPDDFENLFGSYEIYSGLLQDYALKI